MRGKDLRKTFRLITGVLIAMSAGMIGTSVANEQHSRPPKGSSLTACPATLQKSGVCHLEGYDFESVVFNAGPEETDLPLVLALHWSSSEPRDLLKALGRQSARFRMVLPYAPHRKRDGFSFFASDFYDHPLSDQRLRVKGEGARLANFVKGIQKAYQCSDPILVMGVSQGGDLSFQLAHDHPSLVAASFPILGRNMVGRSVGWQVAAPVEAYFSLSDPIVDMNLADVSIDDIRASKGIVKRISFLADGHDVSKEMARALADTLRDHMPRGCKQPNRDRVR